MEETLLLVVRPGGARALQGLRAAATAGGFEEVLRVLAAGEAGQAPTQAAAPPGPLAAAGAPAAAPERSVQAGAPAGAAAAAAPPQTGAAAPAASARPEAVAGARGACAACGAADAPLMCAGCRGARYCGRECQKRDWRAHKAACKQRRQ